jgi:hypothetical protein
MLRARAIAEVVRMGASEAVLGMDYAREEMAELLEDHLGLERFHIYQPNVRIIEQTETQMMASQAQEESAMVNSTDITSPTPEDPNAPSPEAQPAGPPVDGMV